MEESLTLEQQGEAATEFVAGLVREFGLDAEVGFVELDEDTVQVAATGDALGLLVGPRGATLSRRQMRPRQRAAGIGSPPSSCGGPPFGPSPQS